MQKNNPPAENAHASAAGAYSKHATQTTTDPREVEARALLKAVHRLQDLQTRWGQFSAEEMDEILRYNRQIWMMFVDTALADENPDRPKQLRDNIVSLGAYIFRRTLDILADPKKEKLDVLININREIAAGLMTKPSAEQAPAR